MIGSSLPQGWRHTTVGGLAKVNPEALTSRTPAEYAFDYVDIASVTGPDKLLPPQRLTYGDAPSRAKRVVRQGDMIIATVRPYLRAFAMMREPVQDTICSTGFAVVRTRQPQLAEYLYQWFLSPWFLQHAEARMVGSNYPAISGEDVEDFTLLLPPAAEAARIAAILRSVDEAIERTEAVIAALREVKRGMMQELLTRGIGHTKFVACRKARSGVVPSTWRVARLDSVAEVRSGITKGRQVNGAFAGEAAYLRVANVQDGYLDLAEMKTIPILDGELDTFGLQDGDVLMTEGGDRDKLGRGHIWRGELAGCVYQNHIFRVRCNRQVLLPEFLNALTGSDHGKAYFISRAKQTNNLASINATELRGLPVLLPPMEEQAEIVGALSAADAAVERAQTELRPMTELKRGLMQQLLTGKVRTKV